MQRPLKILCFIGVMLLSQVTFAIDAPAASSKSSDTAKVIANHALLLDDIQRFTTVMGEIKQYYVKDVTDKTLFENAIRGMVSGLDPHSAYLDASDLADLETNTKGQFGGLGLEVGMENGLVKVISPIDDTPAKRAGIQSGDYILRLDETPVNGLDLSDVVKKMRGSKGTSIVLTLYRKSAKKPFQVTLTREVIKIDTVKSRVLDNEYGYLRISEFQEPTAKLLKDAITRIMKTNKMPIKGWILDLRDNPGGLLDSAAAISDLFLDSRILGKNTVIVSTKGHIAGSTFTEKATPGDILNNAPLMVLVNGGSASAAEIVTGALQDHGRALVAGTQTFGKGSVQTILPIDEKTAIKLTTSLYYTPSGRSIQAEGIKPDINIPEMTIPKQNENDNIDLIRESELRGHFENQHKLTKITEATHDENDLKHDNNTADLAHEDYQLYQALNIVKSMVMTQAMEVRTRI